MEISIPLAFVIGLFSAGHCLGMCGSISSALSLGLPVQIRERSDRLTVFVLAYNLGRVFSYVAAGAAMGALGVLFAQVLPVYYAQHVLLLLAGVIMILLGLYLGGWWMLLGRLEKIGALLWRRIEPVGRKLLPVRTPGRALAVGLVWGWLPCGLVYSMLVYAVASGSALKGAGLMLAFALGTLPNLLAMGLLAGAAARLARSETARRVAGATVIVFGLYTLWQLL